MFLEDILISPALVLLVFLVGLGAGIICGYFWAKGEACND